MTFFSTHTTVLIDAKSTLEKIFVGETAFLQLELLAESSSVGLGSVKSNNKDGGDLCRLCSLGLENEVLCKDVLETQVGAAQCSRPRLVVRSGLVGGCLGYNGEIREYFENGVAG